MFKQRYRWTFSLSLILFLFCPGVTQAKVDLVTLPDRDKVQVTIYNSADLTLVRENRTLTLKKGENKLQFSWANTLIDPTSLQLFPKADTNKVFIRELSYPPRVKDLGQWRINSQVSGQVPIEIVYFTSGISWQAYYLATLSRDEKEMDLEGYVRVTNRSGEDYENAEVRLIVGKVHLLDEIAELARRFPPYGKPEEIAPVSVGGTAALDRPTLMMKEAASVLAMKSKEIVKEGLSEYFLYTIEGIETIPDGWGKRLPSFQADKVPVLNTYRYEEERYGKGVVRFLTFKNDKDHRLGKEPLPDGLFKVFQQVNPAGELSYLGAEQSKYIPIDQKVELNLGPVKDISVESTLTNYKTENYLFDDNGNITGWDELFTYKVKVANYRTVPVSVEVKRNFPHQYWELTKEGDFGDYEKIDLDTVKFSLSLPVNSSREFTYQVRLFEGMRREQR